MKRLTEAADRMAEYLANIASLCPTPARADAVVSDYVNARAAEMDAEEAEIRGQRGTGRTTRMLTAAVLDAEAGNYVFVVCANADQARRLRNRTAQEFINVMLAGDDKVYIGHHGGSIVFEGIDHGRFEYQTMRMRAAHRDCKLYIDHYAIETEFGHLFAEMHRWD